MTKLWLRIWFFINTTIINNTFVNYQIRNDLYKETLSLFQSPLFPPFTYQPLIKPQEISRSLFNPRYPFNSFSKTKKKIKKAIICDILSSSFQMKRPNIYKKSVNDDDGDNAKPTPDNDDDCYGSRLSAGQPPSDNKLPLCPSRAPPPPLSNSPPPPPPVEEDDDADSPSTFASLSSAPSPDFASSRLDSFFPSSSDSVSTYRCDSREPTRTTTTQQQHRSHHIMTHPVFLQKILPFAATKKESSAIFKSVSSSWEETILHYSGAVLCLKAYVESQEELLRDSHDENSSPTAPPNNSVALELLLRGLRRWRRCPLLPIDAMFDVCDLLGAQFTEENAVHLGLVDKQQESPFETLISSPSLECCHLVGISKEEGSSTLTVIHYFRRLLKLFGDHENNKYRGNSDKTSAYTKEQQAKNKFIKKVLRSTDLLAFATCHVSVEVLQFLVNTFRRIGGYFGLVGQLEHVLGDKRNSVLDEAFARGDLKKLHFFVDTIIGLSRTRGRFGSGWFSNICCYYSRTGDASLVGAMCHYPLARTEHAEYLMEKLRSHCGDEEVKKQLELNPWTERVLRTVTASPLMRRESERWRTFHARCAIHFACEFGSREKLLYVLDLAKGFGDDYFKRFIVLPGCRSNRKQEEFPPLHYALRNVTEGSVDVLECYVEHLLAHVGEEALVKQLKNIRNRGAGLQEQGFKKENVKCLLRIIRARKICDKL